MDIIWTSPPVAMAIFLALAYGLYRLGGALAPSGSPRPRAGNTPADAGSLEAQVPAMQALEVPASEDTGKHMPYTGGELPTPPPDTLRYHRFFRLALLFTIFHVAALILSTLPQDVRLPRTAGLYLVGIAVSVFALTGREE